MIASGGDSQPKRLTNFACAAQAADALFGVFQVRLNAPGARKGALYEEWAEILLEATSIVQTVAGGDGQSAAEATAGHLVKAGEAYLAEGDAASAERCFRRAMGMRPGDCKFAAPLGKMGVLKVEEKAKECEDREQRLQGMTMEEHCGRAAVLWGGGAVAEAQPHIRFVRMLLQGIQMICLPQRLLNAQRTDVGRGSTHA